MGHLVSLGFASGSGGKRRLTNRDIINRFMDFAIRLPFNLAIELAIGWC
jgi:hypothetical protein